MPVGRLERGWIAALATLVAVFVGYALVGNPTYAAIMLEYASKYLPTMTDRGIESVFDFMALGDPRPRVISNLLAYVNIGFRQWVIEHALLHPSLGVNWLIYPVSLALMYRFASAFFNESRAALAATLVYAVSPGLLDTLANYYVPAKALTNAFVLLVLWACVEAARGGTPAARNRWLAVVFLAQLAGLLSDETAVAGLVAGPIVAAGASQGSWRNRLLGSTGRRVLASLGAAAFAFALLAELVFPAINRALGQVPLDLSGLVLGGVYRNMFGHSEIPVGSLLTNWSPFALLETVVSAHAIPNRGTTYAWTSGHPLPHFYQWPWREQARFWVFVAACVVLWRRADSAGRHQLQVLAIAAIAFFLVQALVILRLAPWLTHVNYYAALSSVFVATLVGGLAASATASMPGLVTGWATVGLVMVASATNFLDSSRKHPYHAGTQPTWGDLQVVRSNLERYGLESILANARPTPTTLWAFELAVAKAGAARRQVDVYPRADDGDSPLYAILQRIPEVQDGTITAQIPTAPATETLAKANGARAAPLPFGTDSESGPVVLRGRSGRWNYMRRVQPDGQVAETSWHVALMRAWADTGRVERADGRTCIRFRRNRSECHATLYVLDGAYHAYDADGRLVTSFRREPQ